MPRECSLGRYLEADPIGIQGGPNPYLYVRNNPLRYTDRQGEITAAELGEITYLLLALYYSGYTQWYNYHYQAAGYDVTYVRKDGPRSPSRS